MNSYTVDNENIRGVQYKRLTVSIAVGALGPELHHVFNREVFPSVSEPLGFEEEVDVLNLIYRADIVDVVIDFLERLREDVRVYIEGPDTGANKPERHLLERLDHDLFRARGVVDCDRETKDVPVVCLGIEHKKR